MQGLFLCAAGFAQEFSTKILGTTRSAKVTSAPTGSGVVLVLTLVGVVLVPVMLILTMLAILAGHALGSCVPGVCLWLAIGRLAAFALCRGWLQRREAVQS